MLITIKLFAGFRHNRFKIAGKEHPEGSVCRVIVDGLGLAGTEIGVVMVNGRHAILDQVLREGDTLSIFPLIGASKSTDVKWAEQILSHVAKECALPRRRLITLWMSSIIATAPDTFLYSSARIPDAASTL